MKDTKRISETGDRFNPRKGVKDASPFVSLTLKAAFSFQSPQGVKDASIVLSMNGLTLPGFNPRKG